MAKKVAQKKTAPKKAKKVTPKKVAKKATEPKMKGPLRRMASLSYDCIPVIVVSERHIQKGGMSEFKKAYAKAADNAMKAVDGCKSMFMSVDKKDPNLTHDVRWYENTNAFMEHVDIQHKETMKYDKSKPITGDVFGGWDERIVNEAKK